MSAQIVITCGAVVDRFGSTCATQFRAQAGDVQAARLAAAAVGWTSPAPGRDRCPFCSQAGRR